MNVCLLWVFCVVRQRSLRRADHSSRRVLPTVVRRCVWSRNLKNEEAMTRVGSQRHSKKKKKYIYIYIYIDTAYTVFSFLPVCCQANPTKWLESAFSWEEIVICDFLPDSLSIITLTNISCSDCPSDPTSLTGEYETHLQFPLSLSNDYLLAYSMEQSPSCRSWPL